MQWSSYQKAVFDFVRDTNNSLVINAVAGSGKCLGRDEGILMYDGTIKKVQDIKVGDLLMGDDSTPRTVLSTTRGFGNLKMVVPKKGKSFVCNDVHVLTVDFYNKGEHETLDLAIDKIEQSKRYKSKHPDGDFRRLKLVRTGVEFSDSETEIDPWLYGCWLGDGSQGGSYITNPDQEIVEEVKRVLPKGYYCRVVEYGGKCHTIKILCDSHSRGDNKIRQFFISSSINNEKFIKSEYLITSIEKRLRLLAGLLDSDGYNDGRGCFQISTKWESLGEQILYLVRSLGLAAYMSKVMKRADVDKEYKPYYSISISGNTNIIPTVVKRKQSAERKITKSALRVGFRIDDIGQGEYFGFTLDGNGRFILDDFTITHNTSTIVEASKIAIKKGNVLFLAFNKAIAQELGRKMEGTGVECKTLHSHGFRAIQKKMNYNCSIDERKWNKYISEKSDVLFEGIEFESEVEKSEYISECVKLLNLARINLIRNSEDVDELWGIVDHHNLNADDLQVKVVNDILSVCYKLDDTIDFTDMITLPLNDNMKRFLPKYNTVFVDEAQDLSKAQRELVLASLKPNGRFIAVGDAKQCINGFAGSDIESFKTLTELAQHELPLSVCYRCGKNIVNDAKKIVHYIEPFDAQIAGEIVHTTNLKDATNGDMIICRKSAPLVSTCLKLIAGGKSALVKGRDIADGLKAIVSRTKTDDIDKMLEKIQKEIKKVENRLNRHGYEGKLEDHPQYINIVDKIECIEAIADGCEDVDEVLEKLDDLFTDTKSGNVITLSTVHKAKGLEADNVFILLPDCLPMKRKGQQLWELEQEMNLKYVAITRAKKKLVWVDLNEGALQKVEI
ncbi:MAG: AAA family ATPase [Bacteroidales bacterium]|nr:AAA family ATPase [Bacteroidales bacterium]